MPKLMRHLLLLVILFALNGCAHVDEQWFYVSGASLQEADRHRHLSQAISAKNKRGLSYDHREFVVTGHRIKDGDGVVFAFRSYAPAPFFGVDQASFLKITSVIPRSKINPGMEVRFPDPSGAIAFLSTSSSNLPGQTGCFGYASRGSMRVENASEAQITVTMNLNFDLSSPLGFSGECNERKVQGTHVFQRLRLQELSPWQGVAGKTLYDETIAR